MAEQLVFELATPDPPSFANFLAGGNGEALAAVKAMAAGQAAETGVVLWGAAGSGKSHLLHAAIGTAEARGATAALVAQPDLLLTQEPELLATNGIVAIDDIHLAGPVAQARLFTLFNHLRERGGHLLVATPIPLASLSLREDLRTRLGWGLVYELLPLADTDKPAALAAFARQRGFRLADEVIGYLLVHGRRDLPALLTTLAALDRHSLATKRLITVPLLREWLQREIGFDS